MNYETPNVFIVALASSDALLAASTGASLPGVEEVLNDYEY